jgi:hypothetical protein
MPAGTQRRSSGHNRQSPAANDEIGMGNSVGNADRIEVRTSMNSALKASASPACRGGIDLERVLANPAIRRLKSWWEGAGGSRLNRSAVFVDAIVADPGRLHREDTMTKLDWARLIRRKRVERSGSIPAHADLPVPESLGKRPDGSSSSKRDQVQNSALVRENEELHERQKQSRRQKPATEVVNGVARFKRPRKRRKR